MSINGKLNQIRFNSTNELAIGHDDSALEYLRVRSLDDKYYQLIAKASGLTFESIINGERTVHWSAATNSDLQNNYYSLRGGILISENEDLKSSKFLLPGNYYCPSTITARTLTNCPVNDAFVLKVDFSTGWNYPRQTFRKYNDGIIVSRTYESSSNTWIPEVSYIRNSDLSHFGNINISLKGISFIGVRNKNIAEICIGGTTTEAISSGDNVGSILNSYKPHGYLEFIIYDITNKVSYSMAIDMDGVVKIYNQNVPVGANLRGMVTYFLSNN